MDFFQGESIHRGRTKRTQRLSASGSAPLQLFFGVGIIGYGAGGLVSVLGFLSQHIDRTVGCPLQGAVLELVAIQIPDFVPVVTIGIS